jgi:hypothetical protein
MNGKNNTLDVTQNHVWFCQTSRLVLPNFTRGFAQYHTWFYSTSRVVLLNITPGFPGVVYRS